jgi:hypothetical protein
MVLILGFLVRAVMFWESFFRGSVGRCDCECSED